MNNAINNIFKTLTSSQMKGANIQSQAVWWQQQPISSELWAVTHLQPVLFLNTTLQNSSGNWLAIVLMMLPPKWVFHTIYTFFAPQNMLFSKKENNTKYNIVLLWVTQPQAALPLILLFVVCVSDGGLDFFYILLKLYLQITISNSPSLCF